MNLLDNADNPESILQGNPQLSLDSSPSLSTEQDKQKLASLLQFIRTSQASQLQPPVAPQPGSGVSPSGNTIYGDSRPIDQQPGWNPLLGRGTPGGAYDPLGQFREHANLLQQKIESDKTSDNFKKIILAKFTSGQLKQDEQGNYLEIQQLPNELGQLERKWMPVSLPTAEMLRHIGGPMGIGMADQKQVNAAIAMRALSQQRQQQMPQGNKATINLNNPPPSENPDHPEGFFGSLASSIVGNPNDRMVSMIEEGTQQRPDILRSIGEWWKNIGTRVVGSDIAGRDISDPNNVSPIGEGPTKRDLIDILRARKGLPRFTDKMWQEFLATEAAGQPVRKIFNSPIASPY